MLSDMKPTGSRQFHIAPRIVDSLMQCGASPSQNGSQVSELGKDSNIAKKGETFLNWRLAIPW